MTAPRHPSGTGSVAAIGGHSLHPMLLPVPIGALVMAFGADIALMVTAEPFWGEAAKWLLLAALVSGVLAAVIGFVDLMSINRARTKGIGRGYGIGNILVLFVTGANYLLRAGGDAAAAGSYAIILTAAAVGLVMLTGWMGDDPEFLSGGRPDPGQR